MVAAEFVETEDEKKREMRHLSLLLVLMFLASACSSLQTAEPSIAAPAQTIATILQPHTEVPNSATATVGVSTPVATTTSPAASLPDTSSFPDPASYKWIQVASGLDLPVGIQFPDDGTGRMFVLEQAGRIRIVENGKFLDAPFLDITDRVGSSGDEQGLLGLAFHPDFRDNPYFYVNYTDTNGNTVIARFQANGNTANVSSEKELLHVEQPFQNHNGGQMAFGPDGYLYMGLGDGGSQGDPTGNGQNTNVLLGKILRIDVNNGDPYSIPVDNPFASTGGKTEIWAYGLRNPWRFSFDKRTGNLYIADVGQDLWEEVDVVPGNPPGLNYGWNFYEGLHPYAGQPPPGLKVTMPVTEYSHAEGGCAIVGGFVYRGTLTAWQGIYLYGDYCSGKIWGLLRSPASNSGTGWQSQLLFETGASITTFGQDSAGEIYFADRRGAVYRLGM